MNNALTQELKLPPKMDAEAVRIVALGGLGEVGRNMTVFEYHGKLLIVDCGVLFPEEDQPGVDLILPDFSYLDDRLDDIVGLVLTHGHEDHIGAVPYLLRRKGDEPAPGTRRRRALWATGIAVLAVALLLGGWGARAWTSSQYYVGEDNGKVAVYQGVSQSLGPVSLSELDSTTDIPVESLSQYAQERVRATIPADDRAEAEKIVAELKTSSGSGPHPTGKVTVTTPTPAPSDGSASPSASPGRTGGGDR